MFDLTARAECGRFKYILYKQEMRHTDDKPTEMKLTSECYEYLKEHHVQTNRCALPLRLFSVQSLSLFFVQSLCPISVLSVL